LKFVARNRSHEQKSARNKFHEQNQRHEEKSQGTSFIKMKINVQVSRTKISEIKTRTKQVSMICMALLDLVFSGWPWFVIFGLDFYEFVKIFMV